MFNLVQIVPCCSNLFKIVLDCFCVSGSFDCLRFAGCLSCFGCSGDSILFSVV